MKQRTERFEMRLTPQEAAAMREKAVRYQNVSNYIRKAVTEFSDEDAKSRLELCREVATLCRRFQDKLSWMGSNINQAMKRANELAIAGHLTESYLRVVIEPLTREALTTLYAIKSEQSALAKKAIKL